MQSLSALISCIPESGDWGKIASELLRIKGSNQLSRINVSFSFFVSQLAKSRGRTESTYWRLIKAGEVYSAIREKLDPLGKELPDLIGESVKATPESLEIVDKISRVAPVDVLITTQYRAMRGMISRSELRDLWETYRPVLSGKTARGRQATVPQFDANDTRMQQALDKANRIAPLVQSDSKWLGVTTTPYTYRVMNIPPRKHHLSSLSAVAMLAKSADDPIILNGLYAGGANFPAVLDQSNLDLEDPQLDYPIFGVDRIWYASISEPGEVGFESLPREIGILEISGKGILVIRQALPLAPNAGARSKLMSDLLRQALRIKQPGKIAETA
jgi:hypothetical protein